MKNFTFLYKSCLLSLLAGLLALHPARLLAQAYLMPVSGAASYTTCTGTVYDDGGPTDPHDVNASGTITLRPGTPGAKLKLDFSLLEVDSVNTGFYIYDGPDTKSPVLGRFYGGRPTVYATGSTGALTLSMSAYGYPLRGFAATISCYTGVPPVPDLLASSLQLSPAVVPAGDAFAARARIGSLAGGAALFRARYLLSTDTKADATDPELGRFDSNQMAGTAYTFWQSLTLPSSTAPGQYYVLCVLQLLNGTETNTANNLTYAPLTVAPLTPIPDLAITTLGYDGPTVLGPGSVLSTNVRQQNFGNAPVQGAPVGFYLSADAVLSPDDQLLGRVPAEALAAGKSSLVYQAIALPTGVAPGTYYLLAVADYLDQVIEANEQNNTFAQRLTIAPPCVDVSFGKRLSAEPSQVGPGGSLTVTYSLLNEGNSALDSAAVGYYLSADRTLSPDDVLLDHVAAGPLLTGWFVSKSVTRALTVPAATPLGLRYLLLVADYRHELAETNEDNNLATLRLEVTTPQVDLTFAAASNAGSYGLTAGGLFNSRCTLLNQGSTVAYPATIGYYYSTDNRLSADDVLLGQRALLPLAGAASQEVYYDVTLPATTAVGPAYVLYVADYLGQVAETDELNNVKSVAIQVDKYSVDLTIGSDFQVLPTRAAAGTDIKLSYYFMNEGATAVTGPTVGFYLSADATWSPDDVFMGSGRAYTLYPRGGASRTSLGTIAPTTAPGKYFVLSVADDLNEVAETDETNNVRATPLEVTAARPDLAVLASPLPSLAPRQVLAGGQVTTESYVSNLGAGPAVATTLAYYLSADAVLSANDILLGTTTVGGQQAGATQVVGGAFTVPAATPTGRYYVLFVADYRQQLDDPNRTNNLALSILSVTGAALATRPQLAGYEWAVWPVPDASPTPVQVQLSGPGPRAEATLTLYNSQGQTVACQPLALAPGSRNQAALPTAGLPAGVYVLRLSGPGLHATRRVVVE